MICTYDLQARLTNHVGLFLLKEIIGSLVVPPSLVICKQICLQNVKVESSHLLVLEA